MRKDGEDYTGYDFSFSSLRLKRILSHYVLFQLYKWKDRR